MSRKYIYSIAAALLVLVFIQPFSAMRNFSPAHDEITHLPSGYSYWKTGEIKLNPQHPPLIKLLSALPLLAMDIKYDPNDPNLASEKPNEWAFGKNFIYANDADRIISWGRLPNILISVLLAFFIFKWAAELFNPYAGLAALFIYAFMPNMIAHSGYITTDLGVSAFSFIALYYFWKYLKEKAWKYVILSGLFTGLSLGAKFSGALLVIIMPLIFMAHLLNNPKLLRQRLKETPQILLILLIGALVVWGLYFFPDDPSFYKKGMDSVYADRNTDYSYYLNGRFYQGSKWYYFIFAFLIKTPIPALVIFLASLTLLNKCAWRRLDKAFILIPAIAFLLLATVKAHNIGIRYILPVYPFLMLGAGGLIAKGLSMRNSFWRQGFYSALAILGFWYLLSAASIYPDYLAYFNEFAGGPGNGQKYLDDSNIEWGQDLKRLKEYQQKNPNLKIIYPWIQGNLDYYGIKNNVTNTSDWRIKPSGRYAFSTHFLIRAKTASISMKDPSLDWLDLYKPVGRIGYSFFIYEF